MQGHSKTSGFWRPGEVGPDDWADPMQPRGDFENASAPLVYNRMHYLPLPKQRELLPIFKHRASLLYALEKHNVVVVVGETGCGKTTQIPQYLHEGGWTAGGRSIVCTQPRRVAAISVAARVAEEMGTEVGDIAGYVVRFEERWDPTSTRIKFVTDGLLMRELFRDPLLSKYSVVMIDEAHERSLYTDLLLGLLKKILKKRSDDDFRVIVSSATVDAEELKSFFQSKHCSSIILTLEGKVFPVEIQYLEEPCSNYVRCAAQTVIDLHRLEPDGDILVFMPGMEEVEACVALINDHSSTQNLQVFKLYGALPIHLQTAALKPAQRGYRKIVVSTSIAETSLTLPGVVFVVDCCFDRQPFYNPTTGIESLLTCVASKASCKQRAGRAGRVRPGKCFRLVTEEDFYQGSPDQNLPQLQRANITWAILLLQAFGISDVLHFDFPSPPSAEAMMRALEQLYSLGALTDECTLTKPVGEIMAEIPTEPRIAKTLIASYDYGCTEEMLTIAAMASVQQIFLHPRGSKDLKEKLEESMSEFAVKEGDHITYLNIFEDFVGCNGDGEWCKQYMINRQSLLKAVQIKKQLTNYLKIFFKDQTIKSCDGDIEKIQKCLVSGFFANAACLGPDGLYRTIKEGVQVSVHPSAVFSRFGVPPDYVIFHEIISTESHYMKDVLKVKPQWLLEIAPHYYKVKHTNTAEQTLKKRKKIC